MRTASDTDSFACHNFSRNSLSLAELARHPWHGQATVASEAEMQHVRVIAEYVRTYHDERKRLSAKANPKRVGDVISLRPGSTGTL